MVHSNPGMVEGQLYSPQGIQQLYLGNEGAWWRIDNVDDEPVLEIYRQSQPMFATGMHRMRHMQQYAVTLQVISIVFDANNVVGTEDRERRNTLIALFTLTMVLLTSMLSFFWYHQYLHSRQSLRGKIKRKEKLVALGHLAVDVAHEVRNPFSSIRGLTKYFAERVSAGGETYQLAQVVVKEIGHLNRVVGGLLELVKPTHPTLQAVELSILINHSLQPASQDANSRKIQLRFTANSILPEIQTDPDRLTQALLNLCLNAIQAIGQYNVISVTASESGAGVKVNVTDSGKGVAADQPRAIFTPYFTARAEDAGPGLAVAHSIVEQHGGAIQTASQEGKSTTFILWLPVNITRKDLQG